MKLDKVIWSVDPFGSHKALQFNVAHGLAKLAREAGSIIEPVCVLGPDQLKVPTKAFKGHTKQYQLEGERILQKWVGELKIKNLSAPTLLVQNAFSTRATVDTLLDYARKSGASAIGVGTRTKKTLERFFVGSFAETLILRSAIPIFLQPAQVKVPTKFSHILFASDFSDESFRVFNRLLVVAKTLKAKVTVYYKVEFVMPPAVYGFDPIPVYDEYQTEDLKERRELSKKFTDAGKSSGVTVKVVIDEKPGFVSEAILSAARKQKANLIAMASQSGPIGATLLGSVCRQVVRAAKLPMWIIHPEKSA